VRGGRETVDGEISGGLLAREEEGGQAKPERAARQSRFPGKQGRRFRGPGLEWGSGGGQEGGLARVVIACELHTEQPSGGSVWLDEGPDCGCGRLVGMPGSGVKSRDWRAMQGSSARGRRAKESRSS